MTDKEIIKGIQDLVKAYPNDIVLGLRVREFINGLPSIPSKGSAKEVLDNIRRKL